MNKAKPCKGIGKAIGVNGCGKVTPYRKYGLCDTCRSDFLLNDERGKIILEKLTLKVKAKREKQQQDLEDARIAKRKRNGLETLKINVRTVCHNYIKLRDKHKPCISCGEPWHSDFHAGHFYKSELHSELKYNEHNIHGQCPGCNIGKEGNLSLYVVNLPERIGQYNFDTLNRLAIESKQRSFKWDRQKLNETRKYYQQKIKEL